MASVLLEARPYRPFKSSEEYLYAMREDLAEWLNTLYPELMINVDNFMDRLDTGISLCKVRILIDFDVFCLFTLTRISLEYSLRSNETKGMRGVRKGWRDLIEIFEVRIFKTLKDFRNFHEFWLKIPLLWG